ncbi:MAG: hypothetical protein H0V22_04035 [Solirubrobacterales bacterium]|nr:hypothetical protein [Solirubrobacterales bacterium]
MERGTRTRPGWLLDERGSAGRENLEWDLVYGFEPEEAEERIESWCETGGIGIETDWMRAELEEHVRDEHSTFTWLLEPMIERSGFRIDDADYSSDGMFAGYVLRRL